MDCSLINQDEINNYGIGLWDNPFDGSRNIEIYVYDDVKITLHTNGTNIQFTKRISTEE